MNIVKQLMFIVPLCAVVACGGGGSGGASSGATSPSPVASPSPTPNPSPSPTPSPTPSPSPSPSPTPSPTPTPSPSPAPVLAADMVADESFSFSSEKQLAVSITSDFDGDYFVALCEMSVPGENSFSNCLFRGFTSLEDFNRTFTLANDVDGLSLSVWQPAYRQGESAYEWQSSDGASWEIRYE